MKKTPLLNTALSEIISTLGHTDTLVIADAGLPIPDGPRRIDLALCAGIPSFLETLKTVLTEMQVQGIILASETAERSPQILQAVHELLPGISVESIPHEEFKQRTRSARAVVRTGEFTPYANIILIAGVVF